ncbi:nickel/cobalt transporter [Pseudophaeobacter sp. TrK17]|uniref:nickel/cobalt transporter n=1 Tax=Pseudophaeobacter sp. TrK17 TaxID=2815167 RepID=UPI0035D0AD84
MPRILKALALGLACLALCLCIWWLARGSLAPLGDWAAAHQRDFQNRIAGSLRALRAGEPGAIMALMLVCFAYGFFHAIGPGHGKILVGGYGLARKTPWLRLGGVALLSSLGQAVTAIVLVYGAISLLQLGRDSLIGVAEKTMAPLSYGAIAAIGLWLLLGGARKLWRATGVGSQGGHDLGGSTEPTSGHGHSHSHSHDHNHDHGTSEVCSDCGHRHGPSLEEVSGLQTWREAMVLIAGIAVRPCTGALFVLVITWQMGIALAGIAGAFAMALGTALVTITVGLAALGLRGGALAIFARSGRAAQMVPILEIGAGFLVVLVASGLLFRSLA